MRKIGRGALADHHDHLEAMYRKMAVFLMSQGSGFLGVEITPAEREMAARELRELASRHGSRSRELKETI